MRAEAHATDGVQPDEVRRERGPRVRGIAELLVERVTRLVERAEETLRHPFVVHPRRDAYIVAGEGDLERMDGQVESATIRVVPELLRHPQREGELPIHRERLLEEVHARRLLLRDRRDERLQTLLEGGEERLERRHRFARLEAVHEGVVRVLLVADALGHLPVQLDRLLEHRSEGLEVTLRACLHPDVASDPTDLGSLVHELRGDAQVVLDRLAHLGADRALHARLVEVRRLGLRRVQKATTLVADEVVTSEEGQRRHLLRPSLGPHRRHHGPRVPAQDRLGAKEVVDHPHTIQ